MAGGTRFLAKYEASVARNDSLLCVGLDPDPERIPPGQDPVAFLQSIVEATADLVCCYKPNASFFEALPGGLDTLRPVLAAIPEGVPVLLDAKRNDIGNSARFYARAVFERLDVDAVTVNPYLGGDSLQPFFDYADRHSFVLCRTSNAGGGDLQDLEVDGRPLYEHVARLCERWNAPHGNVGLVVGATYPEEAAHVRSLAPALPILAPGIGAQAGALEATVAAAIDASGRGLLVNASRDVLYASSGAGFAEAARARADELRRQLNEARRAAVAG